MLQIIFKNLDRSELATHAVEERFANVMDRFPDLKTTRVVVTLEMENSPTQAGPDVFNVKIHCRTGRYRGLIMEKSADNLYAALADLVDHLLEKLNRFGDKTRVKNLKKARRLQMAVGAAE